MNCKNCGHTIKSTDKFCSNCGQKNREKLSFKVLLGELFSSYLSWDSKLIKTIIPLLFKPGEVSKNYLAGKRKSYVAPVRLYIFVSIVFFFTLAIIDSDSSGSGDESFVKFNMGESSENMERDSLVLMVEHNQLDQLEQVKQAESPFLKHLIKQAIRINVESGSFNNYLRKNVSIMFFIFIPVFGWVLKLFFLKKKWDYIEHTIYGLYFHSFLFILMWLSLLISQLIGDGWPLIVAILGAYLYLVGGIKRFYEKSTGVAILRSTLIALVYFLLFVLFAAGTITLTIWAY